MEMWRADMEKKTPYGEYCFYLENVELHDTEKKLVKKLADVRATLRKSVEECIKELRSIADDIDLFHKNATIASVVGSSVGLAGGVATIVGLCLAPITLGASLIVTMGGVGVATAGGITGAVSSIADNANIRNKGKRVEEIMQIVQSDTGRLKELLESINAHIEDLKRRMGVSEADITRASTRGVFAAVEITRLAQLLKLSDSTARAAKIIAQGAKAATDVSGIIAALLKFLDIAFVAKGAKDLIQGAKVEQAQQIRTVADELETEFEKLQAAVLEVENGFSIM